MSIERAADLMGVLLEAPVSTGFASGLARRVAERLVGFEQALKQRLPASPVLHHDETTARVAGDNADRLLYIYTARAGTLTWFGGVVSAAVAPLAWVPWVSCRRDGVVAGQPGCRVGGGSWRILSMAVASAVDQGQWRGSRSHLRRCPRVSLAGTASSR